ncbi:MAG: lamin tail domain-containing protein [Bacteroidales bacterium]|nr:lamin tail domain-containing protein [Bacteroidales bacterium]
MKKVFFLALLMPYMAFGQIVENFESGEINNWVQSPAGHWISDTTDCISGRFSLHHSYDNSDAGSDMIGIPINDLHLSDGLTRWSFLIRYGYDPSSSNNWALFLLSDSEPAEMSPDGLANGFALGVNLTGYDDTLRLWKVKSGVVTTVVNTHINWQTVIGVAATSKIVIERTMQGSWSVSVYRMNDDLVGSGSWTDNELFNSDWFGIYYKYTSTRDKLLWFDDLVIDGIFYKDIEAPAVTGCLVSERNSVDITLNETPADGFILVDNFSLDDPDNSALSVTKINGQLFRVQFAHIFNNKKINNLTISSLCDNSGNCDQNISVKFTPVWAEPGDVIISEIMADPLPEVSLPGKEYLELTNRTEYSFNLKNWNLTSQDQNFIINKAIIQPREILIVCLSKDTLSFAKYGKVIGLKQFPSLTDGGKILCLSDSSDNLIHGVEYSSDWYLDELKSAGGWSLEMEDIAYPFYYEGNWKASVSRNGGTPGSINSVIQINPDISFYGVQNIFPVDSINISVRFSEPVFNLIEDISFIKVDGQAIISLYSTDPLFREFIIKRGEPLLRRKRYELNISGDIKDFAGNTIQNGTMPFGLPEPAVQNDLLFNELLFNPLPGDPDYLELFNCSEKIIDASRLQLISINDGLGDTSQLYLISEDKRCIMPGSYYAITTDVEKICERYFSTNPEYLFESRTLPSMSDDEGHIVLFNRELDKIDEVIYNEGMHYSLLSGDEGIALEKTAPQNRSEVSANWHSASESSGWGTPGAPNSMFIEVAPRNDEAVFSSSKITPDSDGIDDILTIGLNLAGNGNVVSVIVFDESGRYVKKIAGNMFIGVEASLVWDGTADDGSPVNTGIYIILITLYDDTGKTNQWKKVCTVLR